MIRTVAGVIVGYLALAIFIFLTFSIFYMLTGPTFAWTPGTTDASMGWMTGAIVLSFVGALFGGWVAAKIGRSSNAVYALAGLVLILGVVNAVVMAGADRSLPEGRTIESLSVIEAAQYTTQPPWYNYLVPILGAVGVILGGRSVGLRKRVTGDVEPRPV